MSGLSRSMRRDRGAWVEVRARVPQELREDLQGFAEDSERSLEGEVRRALRLYVEMKRQRGGNHDAAA